MKKHQKNRTLYQKITQGYLYSMLTVFLLFCGAQGYQHIVETKFRMFCVLCGGYVAIMAVLGIEEILIGNITLSPARYLMKKSSWTQRFCIFYVGVTWISAIFSPYFPATIIGGSRYEGALTITLYGLTFLLLSIFGHCAKGLLCVSSISVGLVSLLSIIQMHGKNPFSLYPVGYTYLDAGKSYSGAYLGTLGNIDLMAAFLCLVVPILWISLFRLKTRRRLLLMIPLTLALFVLIKMRVQAGLLGVFLGGIFSLPIILPDSKKRRIRAAFIIGIGFVTFLIVIFAFDSKLELWHEIHLLFHGKVELSFGSGRLHIWREVLQKIPNHPILGNGPDTMIYAQLQPFQRYDPAGQVLHVAQIDVAHNEYLNVLYHQGVTGIVSFLLLVLASLKSWFKFGNEDAVIAILGGGIFCYCIQAFFSFSMCITAPFFWLEMGLLEGRTKRIKEDKSS